MTAPRHRLHDCISTAAVTVAVTIMMTHAADAAGSSMPWEAPLQRILDSVEGPVAKIVAVIIIVVTGLTLLTVWRKALVRSSSAESAGLAAIFRPTTSV